MKHLIVTVTVAFAIAFTGCAAESDPDPAPEPGEAGDPVLWGESAEVAVELVAHPSLPAGFDPATAPSVERAAPTTGPVAAVPTTPVCAPAPEVPCDGLDQDCDHTDICDANGDGIAEAYAPTGDPFIRRGLTTE